MQEVKTEIFLNSNPEITYPIPEAKTLIITDRIAPDDFSAPDRIEPEAVPATPEQFEEPLKTERIEEKVPIVASVDSTVQDTRVELSPEPTYSTI